MIAGVAAITAPSSFGQIPEELRLRLEKADREIVRLSTAAFPDLPGDVARELQRRGCTIPQEAFTKKPHNVVRGEFAKPGQTDWAVLCSINRVSTILMFWNGSGKDPAEIARMADIDRLQGITADQIGYSRGISAVGKTFIMDHYRAYGGPEPPLIDHRGIDDAFIEKASVTLYYHSGKWLRLTGAD